MAEENLKGSKLIPADGGISLDFGVALEALRMGKKIWRQGWNDNKIRIVMISIPVAEMSMEKVEVGGLGIPVALNESEKLIDYWHPSPTDLFAQDWHFE